MVALIGPTFKEILIREYRHLSRRTVRRVLESGVRHLCDYCSTTIFAGYWMCLCCGTEICLECYDGWISNLNYKCKFDPKHRKYSYFPISRMPSSEVEGLLNDVDEHVDRNIHNIFEEKRRSNASSRNVWSEGEMSLQEFRQMYRLGRPFAISSVNLTKNLWTPKYFERHFGRAKCICIDLNERNEQKSHSIIRVGEFFNGFNKVKQRNSSGLTPCLKLKVSHSY